jgi:hypothetical protein
MARRRSYSNPESPRKRLSGEKLQKLRQKVFIHYGEQCWLCGGDGADTIDHIIPVADGGDDSLDNLRPAHGRKSRKCTGNFSRKRTQEWDTKPAPLDKYSELPDGITFGDRCIIRRRGTMISTAYVDYEKLGMDHPYVQMVIKHQSS